ncbi:cell division protein ZapA [Alkalispirillum mobile]|uniref:Cell division protein ZapA n=1 Tax=Alkalispirillum mobile TaxID=85925 RepID=A0A498BY42_9GAMM|nr:cell division protein ZapA [Alkalispirillum mobile]RLK48202.1 cell division protein ZapA [Alkalispirillum mobile]
MTEPVKIQILDKEYMIGCPEEEKQGLLQSADYLHRKMKEIRDRGKVLGTDRIAVMAALNITYELLEARRENESMEDVRRRLRALDQRIAETTGD